MPGGPALLPLLFLGFLLGGTADRRLICWQAMILCQEEADCRYAYSQYEEACSSVFLMQEEAAAPSHNSARRRCPSHCISALIQLNHTKWGPALEDCDCAKDESCRDTKRAIEPCLPRTSTSVVVGGGGAVGDGGADGGRTGGGAVMGCMEARKQCEKDRRCSISLSRYLIQCGRLFNGLHCTDECKEVIADMMRVPKALLLNDCVCDGMERPICESIKENMARLCFGVEVGNAGSSGRSEDEYDDEYDDDTGPTGEGSYEDDQQSSRISGEHGGSDSGAHSVMSAAATARTVIMATSIMLLMCVL
ncbi:hypothetical protein GDO86_001488 [Hymenochirus boettgeri]|uniref:GDNF/GAS1 domain-containing protein n=1 Tax=Hymenochirus boettgeri TaxID=247094 RepID=A0A8T2KDV7_9PIPI|nr:hypothetical protein GDO86_001488 [Hymenochirus boettgeri]